jgi:hypothetical protein
MGVRLPAARDAGPSGAPLRPRTPSTRWPRSCDARPRVGRTAAGGAPRRSPAAAPLPGARPAGPAPGHRRGAGGARGIGPAAGHDPAGRASRAPVPLAQHGCGLLFVAAAASAGYLFAGRTPRSSSRVLQTTFRSRSSRASSGSPRSCVTASQWSSAARRAGKAICTCFASADATPSCSPATRNTTTTRPRFHQMGTGSRAGRNGTAGAFS